MDQARPKPFLRRREDDRATKIGRPAPPLTPSGGGHAPTPDRSKTPATGSPLKGVDCRRPVTEEGLRKAAAEVRDTIRPRRWSAARKRRRGATGIDGVRGRSASRQWAPRPGGGSASGQGGARPPLRPRPAGRGAPPWPQRQRPRAPLEGGPLLGRGRPR